MVAHLHLARVLRDLRRFDELDAQLERMRGLEPTHPLILSAQAMLPLRREGDIGPALRLLRQQPEAFYPETRWHVALFARDRSEEHTSELQSLMRISYAVFCLKKKKS